MGLVRQLFFYLCWPGLYVYFKIGDRSRVIIRCGSEVVIVKGWWNRLFADERWSLPGGGRRRHETELAGACREVFEEIGLSVKSEQLKHIGRQKIGQSGVQYTADFFLLELAVKPTLTVRGETTAVKWSQIDRPDQLEPYGQDIVVGRELLRSHR